MKQAEVKFCVPKAKGLAIVRRVAFEGITSLGW